MDRILVIVGPVRRRARSTALCTASSTKKLPSIHSNCRQWRRVGNSFSCHDSRYVTSGFMRPYERNNVRHELELQDSFIVNLTRIKWSKRKNKTKCAILVLIHATPSVYRYDRAGIWDAAVRLAPRSSDRSAGGRTGPAQVVRHAAISNTPRRRRSAVGHPLPVPQPPLLPHQSCHRRRPIDSRLQWSTELTYSG